jgi:TolB protein
MRIFRYMAYFILTLTFLLPGVAASGKIYIDIDSPNFQKFPIAITDFQIVDQGGRHESFSAWFSDSLSGYLVMTGFFDVIHKRAFLVDPKSEGQTTGNIKFSDWGAIGAEYLVKGNLLFNGENLVAEMRLFDVIRGEMITARKLSGRSDDKSEMVRTFANEILSVLTGSEGLFDTTIAFVLNDGRESDIYLIDFDGSNMRRLTDHRSIMMSPRWSPDGRYIVFTSFRDGNPDIYIKSLFSKTADKIVGFMGVNLPGSWSRDGSKILLTSSKDGNEEIYVMDIPTRRLKRLTYDYAIDVSPAWSPDNEKIAFVSNRSGSPQLYVMDTNGDNVRRVTYEGNYNTSPSWSPKGDRIAYEGLINGRFQIFTIHEDGSQRIQLTAGNEEYESPSWSPDGRYLVLSAKGHGKTRISIVNANGMNMRTLYECTKRCNNPSWSPRGSR